MHARVAAERATNKPAVKKFDVDVLMTSRLAPVQPCRDRSPNFSGSARTAKSLHSTWVFFRLELNRIDPNDKEKRKKVNRLAEKLVECAIEDKQAWAFQQIADRLEGKPVQVVDATVDDHRTVDQFSDAELTAILRRRVGVVAVESDEERPESAALN
jgi:hypothetical protein